MSSVESDELTIEVSSTGQISTIRGQKLPAGLVYSPVEPGESFAIPVASMKAMTSAVKWAFEAQQEAAKCAETEAP